MNETIEKRKENIQRHHIHKVNVLKNVILFN